jgi:dipeptidyl aminopeptidase/acylaminoacyl peptidase
LLRPGLEFAFLYAKARYGVDVGAASAAAAVARPGAPILLIHGVDDDNVPVRHAEMIESANPGRVTAWLIPGARHDNAGAGTSDYGQRVAGFLAAHRRVR